jgi:hypothetical protein
MGARNDRRRVPASDAPAAGMRRACAKDVPSLANGRPTPQVSEP